MAIRWQFVTALAISLLSAGLLSWYAIGFLLQNVSFGTYENNDFMHLAQYMPGSLIYIFGSALIPILMAWVGVYVVTRTKKINWALGFTILAWLWFLPNMFFFTLLSL